VCSSDLETYLDLQDVCFAGPRHGYAVGGVDGPGFVHTADGGLTWIVDDINGQILRGVCFPDTARGVAVGSPILGTLDGGQTWSTQMGTAHGLADVAFFDADVAVAVGTGGAIMRTNNGGWLTAVPPWSPASGATAAASLRTCPNPFNPRTTIAFAMPVAGRARLRVYDVAGRLVRTLTDAEFLAGDHLTTWDGKDSAGRTMSSGVYFAGLESGDRIETARMVLIR